MTNATELQHNGSKQLGAGDRRPTSVHTACIVAGICIVLMIPLGGGGYFAGVESLTTHGDAQATAASIVGSMGVFRIAIVTLALNIVLDVIVAWALFRVFRAVNTNISILAAWLRIVFAGVFLVAVGHLYGVVRLLQDDGALEAFSEPQRHSLALLRIETFTDIWDAGLILFGVHLILIGYLAFRSGFVPRALGILAVIAGLGYITDSVGKFLVPDYGWDVGLVTFPGELLVALWFLFRSRRIDATVAATAPSPLRS